MSEATASRHYCVLLVVQVLAKQRSQMRCSASVGEQNIAYLAHDTYYKDIDQIPLHQNNRIRNFDHPHDAWIHSE